MTWTKWWQRGNAPIRRLGQRGPWSRRAFLGGGAAVITLPFLESLRGGAWADSTELNRSASRYNLDDGFRGRTIGLRVVRSAPAPAE